MKIWFTKKPLPTLRLYKLNSANSLAASGVSNPFSPVTQMGFGCRATLPHASTFPHLPREISKSASNAASNTFSINNPTPNNYLPFSIFYPPSLDLTFRNYPEPQGGSTYQPTGCDGPPPSVATLGGASITTLFFQRRGSNNSQSLPAPLKKHLIYVSISPFLLSANPRLRYLIYLLLKFRFHPFCFKPNFTRRRTKGSRSGS